MKDKIFKTAVSKLHFPLAFFILINLITGYYNINVSYSPSLVNIHFYTGVLILGAPLIVLLTLKNKKAALKAFSRLTITFFGDFIKKKYFSGIRKLTASIAFLLILVSMVTGIMLKFHLISFMNAYKIHTFDYKFLIVIIPIHLLLGLYLLGKKRKTTIRKARDQRN